MGSVLEILAVNAKSRRKIDRKSLVEKRNHHRLSTETQHLPSSPVGFFFLTRISFKPLVQPQSSLLENSKHALGFQACL